MNRPLALALLSALASVSIAQSRGALLNYSEQPALTLDQLDSFTAKVLSGFQGVDPYGTAPPARDGIRVFAVQYASIDFNGKPNKVSGLVTLPANGSPRGLAVYMHGTAVGDVECPSSGIGDAKGYYEARAAVAAFGGEYAVAMPDYIGQGVNGDFHPYVMGSKNAPSGKDIILAAYQLAAKLHVPVGNDLFLSGYSEGGHNAMSLCQLLEAQPIPGHKLVACAPLSGPYDLSGSERIALDAPQAGRPDKLQYAIPFLAACLVHSCAHYYGNLGITINQTFKWGFAYAVPVALHGDHTNLSATQLLGAAADVQGYRADKSGNYHLSSLLKAPAASAMSSGDSNYPLIKVMAMYNNYDWAPKTPMYLVGLKQDTLVAFTNTEKAVAAMRARGVTSATMNYYGIDAPSQSHITENPGQVILARRFFDSGFLDVPKG